MKTRLLLILVACIILLGAVVYFMLPDQMEETPLTWEDVTALPASPLNASYLIEDTETQLLDGRSEREITPGSAGKAITEVWGDVVYGDLSDTGDNSDAALILRHSEGGSGTFYYVASALKDEDGYLGTNAVYIGDRIAIQNISIEQGMVVVNYADRREGQSFSEAPTEGRTAYLVTSGAYLRQLGPFEKGEEVLRGELVYGHEVHTFTPCGRNTPYWIASSSRASSALKAVYEERTRGKNPYTSIYAVLVGTVVDVPEDGFGADYDYAFDVHLLAQSPIHGTCTATASSTTLVP